MSYEPLTSREVDILRHVAEGAKNREIAEELSLSEKSIEKQLTIIFEKLDVRNRAQAAGWYKRQPLSDETAVGERQDERLLALYSDYVKRISQVRIGGNFQVAIEMADSIAKSINSTEREVPSETFRYRILKLREQVLLEQVVNYNHTSLPDDYFQRASYLSSELKSLAQKTRDDETKGLAYLVLGDGFYVKKDYIKSAKLFRSALGLIHDVDLKLWAIRNLSLDLANLGEKDEFEKVSSVGMEYIRDGSFVRIERACETLEGFARGSAKLGISDGGSYFEQSESLAKEIKDSKRVVDLLAVQRARSKLENMKILGGSKNLFERTGNDGLALAEDGKFIRHIYLLEQLLNVSLN